MTRHLHRWGCRLGLAALAALACSAAAQQPPPPREVEFEDLAWLTDREIQVLLLEVDQRDLVRALKGASAQLRQTVLGNMSRRLQGFIEEEMQYVTSNETTQQASRRRIVALAAQLGAARWVAWPPRRGGRPSAPAGPADQDRPLLWQSLKGRFARPLAELGFAGLAEVLGDISALARREGVLALEDLLTAEDAARGAEEGFLYTGLGLIVDGTEPSLVREMLETRLGSLLQQQETRCRMMIKGVGALQAGDNPCLTERALHGFYADAAGAPAVLPGCWRYGNMSPQERRADLTARARSRAPTTGVEELAEFLVGVSSLARGSGMESVGAIAGLLDHEVFLSSGLKLALDGTPPELVAALMQARLQGMLETQRLRYRMIVEGVWGLQWGESPAQLRARVDSLYAE